MLNTNSRVQRGNYFRGLSSHVLAELRKRSGTVTSALGNTDINSEMTKLEGLVQAMSAILKAESEKDGIIKGTIQYARLDGSGMKKEFPLSNLEPGELRERKLELARLTLLKIEQITQLIEQNGLNESNNSELKLHIEQIIETFIGEKGIMSTGEINLGDHFASGKILDFLSGFHSFYGRLLTQRFNNM